MTSVSGAMPTPRPTEPATPIKGASVVAAEILLTALAPIVCPICITSKEYVVLCCKYPYGIEMDVLFVVSFGLSQTTVPPLFLALHVVDACVSDTYGGKADVDSVGVVEILSGYPDGDIGVFTKAPIVENVCTSPKLFISGFFASSAKARTS